MLLVVEKLVVDSSVFISSFGKDKFSSESKEFLKAIQPPNIHIVMPSITVAETIVNLRKQKMRNLKRILSLLLNFNLAPLDDKFLEKFYLISKSPTLKTSDLIIAATAKMYDATLISWDKKHLSRDQKICKALSPKQYLKQS